MKKLILAISMTFLMAGLPNAFADARCVISLSEKMAGGNFSSSPSQVPVIVDFNPSADSSITVLLKQVAVDFAPDVTRRAIGRGLERTDTATANTVAVEFHRIINTQDGNSIGVHVSGTPLIGSTNVKGLKDSAEAYVVETSIKLDASLVYVGAPSIGSVNVTCIQNEQ